MTWEVVLPAVLASVVHLSPQYLCSLVFRSTPGQRLLIPGWYGEGDRVIEICTRTAVCYHTGLPPVIEYLREENRALREQLGQRRLLRCPLELSQRSGEFLMD